LTISRPNTLSLFGILPTKGSMFIISAGKKALLSRPAYWWVTGILAAKHNSGQNSN